MVVTMPPKLVWDTAIPALSAWLTNIFEVSRHLRDLHTLQLSLEVIIEACGFHHLTQPLAFLHRICLFINLYTVKSQDFSAEALNKHLRKARTTLDIPTVSEDLRKGFRCLMNLRAFRLSLPTFREAYNYLTLLQYELCQGPYRNAFQVLIDDVYLIYEEIQAHIDHVEALERFQPPEAFERLQEAYERSWTRPLTDTPPQPEPSTSSQPRPSGIPRNHEA